MSIRKPTYTELEERLAEAEAAIGALRHEEVDAVVGEQHVLLLRLKEIEQALRESEEFSSGLLANSPNPILVINPDTSIGYVNPAMERLTGFSKAELVGTKAPYPWWADETLDKIREDFEEAVLKGKGAYKLEELFQTKAGARFQVEITSTFVKSNGESKYCLENWVDITERQQIQARLLWEASLNEAIADLSSALILPKSIEDIAYDVLEHAKRLTSSEFGYVSHIDPQAGYHIASTLSRDVWDICRVENKDIIFEKFTGLWGWVLDNRKPLMTNDPSNDPRSCGTPEGHVPIRRFLSVPALIDGMLVGQISLANSDHDYTERDLAVVDRLAALYAIALQRKRGEEELQRARDKLEQRVQERTAELAEANVQLRSEIEERRRAEEHIIALSQQLIQAQEIERQRISCDLHDNLAQNLTSIKISLDTLFDDEQDASPEKRQSISGLSEMIRRAIAEARNLSYYLRPGDLDELGLVQTVRRYCKEFYAKIGLKVKFLSAGMDDLKLDSDTAITLYRLVQEGLTNVHKHADASNVTVKLIASFPNIILRIEDDGRGFELKKRLQEALEEKRMGLRSMEQRVALLNGKIEIESRPGKGTKILVEVPYKEKNSGQEKDRLDY